MFLIMAMCFAIGASGWLVWRANHMEKMGRIKSFCLFVSILVVWMLPMLIRDRGSMSGALYTSLYHFLYYVFIWNFFYCCLMGLRDGIWLTGYIWRWFKKQPYGVFDFFRVDLIRRTTYVLIIVSFGFATISYYCGMKTPDIREVTIQTDKLSSDITMVVLSDIHLNRVVSPLKIKNIVKKANAVGADIIVLPGDVIDDYPKQIQPHLEALSQLKAVKGVYAVAGNHEFYTGHNVCKQALQKNGITYLFNEGVQVTPELYLAGIPDHQSVHIISDAVDISRALFSAEDEHYKVLLSHRPKFIDKLQKGQIDLQISGHTHGAQFFPLHFVVKLFNGYLAGLYDTPNGKIYVSRGAGQWGPQMRFLAPSEITVIHLVSVPKGSLNKVEEKSEETVHRSDIPDFDELWDMTDELTAVKVASNLEKSVLVPLKPQTETTKQPKPVAANKTDEQPIVDTKEPVSVDIEAVAKQAFEDAKASLDDELSDILAQAQSETAEDEPLPVLQEPVNFEQDETVDVSDKEEITTTDIETKPEVTVVENKPIVNTVSETETVIFIDNRSDVPIVSVYDGRNQEKIADSTFGKNQNVKTKKVTNSDGSVTTTETLVENEQTPTGRTTRRIVRVLTEYPEKRNGKTPAESDSSLQKERAAKAGNVSTSRKTVVVPAIPTVQHRVVPVTVKPISVVAPQVVYPVHYAGHYEVGTYTYQPSYYQPQSGTTAYGDYQNAVYYYPSGY